MGKFFVFVAVVAVMCTLSSPPALAGAPGSVPTATKTIHVKPGESKDLGSVTIDNTGVKKDGDPDIDVRPVLAKKDGDGVRKGDTVGGTINLGGKDAKAKVTGLSEGWLLEVNQNQAGFGDPDGKPLLTISGDGGAVTLDSSSYNVKVTAEGGSVTVNMPSGASVTLADGNSATFSLK